MVEEDKQRRFKGARYEQGGKMLPLLLYLTKIITIDNHDNAPPPITYSVGELEYDFRKERSP
ncbi:MAG: hypothetical protein F6K24_05620 [Okeania sp. SIO2D1]|nr:hypothetical protein [Okeania sp. SIO2D1]